MYFKMSFINVFIAYLYYYNGAASCEIKKRMMIINEKNLTVSKCVQGRQS